jgi:hypothetical protein
MFGATQNIQPIARLRTVLLMSDEDVDLVSAVEPRFGFLAGAIAQRQTSRLQSCVNSLSPPIQFANGHAIMFSIIDAAAGGLSRPKTAADRACDQ